MDITHDGHKCYEKFQYCSISNLYLIGVQL